MKTTEAFMSNAFLVLTVLMALSIAAPLHAGGIADRVFGGGAKNLAKQASDLTRRAAEIERQAAEIEEKAAALSARDRRTFQEELARLGVQPPSWLFRDAQDLLTGAPEDTEDYTGGGLLGGIARVIGGIVGGRSARGTATGNNDAPTAPTTTTTRGGGIVDRILGGASSSSLNGTWVHDFEAETRGFIGSMEMTYNNGDWEAALDGAPFIRGTYTTSAGAYTSTVTHLNGGYFLRSTSELGLDASILGIQSRWYTRAEWRATLMGGMMPDSSLDDIFRTETVPYSISGNTLTMTGPDGNTSTATRKR